jgi:hypothetical protein
MKILMVTLVISLGFACESRADFIGHDMSLTEDGGNGPLFEGVLTPAGFQYIASPPDYSPSPISAELTGSSLALFLALPPTASFFGGLSFTLSDLTDSNQVISSVTVDPASDIIGFTAADVSFNNENVFVNLGGLQIMGGQQALLDFTFSGDPTPIVPEPATLPLLCIGVAGLAAVKRRFSHN